MTHHADHDWTGHVAPFAVEDDANEVLEVLADRIVEKLAAKIAHPGEGDQEVFNRTEAAEFLRLKVSTLDKLTKDGKIAVNVATRKPLYLRESLLDFLRKSSVGGDRA